MIKVNLLKDHTDATQEEQKTAKTSPISLIGLVYIVAVAAVVAVLGYMWISSGNTLKQARADNQRLERELKEMEDLRKQFVELEARKQELKDRIDIIENLLGSQKGPVEMMNAVIQAIPQSRDIWLISLEQTAGIVSIRGETRIPEVLPDFMKALEKSSLFTIVDIDIVERRDEISNFTIVCASR